MIGGSGTSIMLQAVWQWTQIIASTDCIYFVPLPTWCPAIYWNDIMAGRQQSSHVELCTHTSTNEIMSVLKNNWEQKEVKNATWSIF